MASIGVSEMLGNPIKLSGATRSAPSASSPATFETVALFGKKKAAPPPPSKKAAAAVTPANDELAKWYGFWLKLKTLLLIVMRLSLSCIVSV
ncbi:chlorophyll a-b binding protein CP26, chloroplastic-like [Arachis stenosperma]|uniref:chlorophyll a-b binding protein CP26, chloroplastic-like n=1 Tax=Arachis stenosperma TaxID=217475 RepID=UPI0025ABA8BF|nr:chlorophyll a-b binding protein CP26, chloroplastic-like [Arachis stenosperma]